MNTYNTTGDIAPPTPPSPYNPPFSITARKKRVEVNGVTYHWVGGFGAIIESYEWGVRPGDVRVIGGIPFYAYMVEPTSFFRKPLVSWSVPNPHLTNDFIHEFRNALF